MKVKVISRSTEEFTRERSQDLQRVFRNFDPNIRSQDKSVEYGRALNAAKLDKIFARPFVGALDGHIDAVSSMAKNPNHLKDYFRGLWIEISVFGIWPTDGQYASFQVTRVQCGV